MRTRLTSIIVTALLVVIPHTAQALTLINGSEPQPLPSRRGHHLGTLGSLTLTNIGHSRTATITGISVGALYSILPASWTIRPPISISSRPNPAVASRTPVVGACPLANFNIKFSWDAVDTVKDNDVDFGVWHATFTITGMQTGRPPTDEAFAVLQRI